MKAAVGVCVVFVLALLGVGSAIKCYHCKDYSGSCSKIRDCYYDDACVSVYERGGDIYRQCIKYSDCDRSNIAEKFPRLSSFKYSCCTSDLCNTAAPVTVSSRSVVGILLSLALFWWGVL